jgi:hypothetical protein
MRAWMARELERLPKPLAVFAFNDYDAAWLVDTCVFHKISVPDEVAILGVDNNEMVCVCLPVPLSSIQHDLERIGYEAAALLDRMLEGEAPPESPLLIPPKGIITRRSTDYSAVNNPQLRQALLFIREHLGDRLFAYAWLLRSSHPFSPVSVAAIDEIIEETAAEHGVDPAHVKAIAVYESYDLPNAISTTGAMGLMALMPRTARAQGVQDPFDPRDNVAGGVRLLKKLSEEFHGDVALVVAAYNAGAGSVRAHGGVPRSAETSAYVKNVLHLRDFFERESRRAASAAPVAQ